MLVADVALEAAELDPVVEVRFVLGQPDLDLDARVDVEVGEGERSLAVGSSTTVAVPEPAWPSSPVN